MPDIRSTSAIKNWSFVAPQLYPRGTARRRFRHYVGAADKSSLFGRCRAVHAAFAWANFCPGLRDFFTARPPAAPRASFHVSAFGRVWWRECGRCGRFLIVSKGITSFWSVQITSANIHYRVPRYDMSEHGALSENFGLLFDRNILVLLTIPKREVIIIKQLSQTEWSDHEPSHHGWSPFRPQAGKENKLNCCYF
jgi:hypothetical protein